MSKIKRLFAKVDLHKKDSRSELRSKKSNHLCKLLTPLLSQNTAQALRDTPFRNLGLHSIESVLKMKSRNKSYHIKL